jgi:hypothetical protein
MQGSIQKFLRRMLMLFSIGSVLLLGFNNAQSVTLSWQASKPAPDGYELYLRKIGEDYDYTRAHYKGPEAFCEIEIEDDGIAHFFIVRTYVGNQFSEFSDEVVFIPPISTDPIDNDIKAAVDEMGKSFKDGAISVLWPNGEKGVDLAPVLILSSSYHGLPFAISWRISTNSDMSIPVLSVTSSDQNLTFKVPDMLLDTDTQYYWQAVFYDKNGDILGQTKVASFVTISSDRSDDLNFNGIPDFQEINEVVDLDSNGIIDTGQADLLCVKAAKGGMILGIQSLSPGASLVAVKTYDENNYNNSLNKPEIINYGLLGFKLFLKDGTDKAEIKVYFSTPVDQVAMWYKFDSKKGYSVFENAVFSDDRKSVTFTLVDGGFGDEDGIKNGIIVDPSGIGMMSQEKEVEGTLNTSCFADTLNFL